MTKSDEATKTCAKCSQELSVSLFYAAKQNKDGLSSYCKSCVSQYRREWYARNKGKSAALYMREWREKQGPKAKQSRLARHLSKAYGITIEQRDQMLKDQGEACAICRRGFSEEIKPHVDHCHDSSRVRGILCRDCNLVLGIASDDPERLRAAAAYLEA